MFTPSSSLHRRPDLPSLTSIRAFAALAVFAYHLHPWQQFAWLAPLKYGYTGVTIFFVLSGFILTWTHNPAQNYRQFYLRRFARIYPTYLVVLCGVLCWSAVSGNGRDLGATLTNLTLIHAWFTDPGIYAGINGVTWSLACEMFFYALFPLLWRAAQRISLRSLWCIVGGIFAGYAIVTVTIASQQASRDVLQTLYANPLARLPEFLLGIAVASTSIAGKWIPGWLTGATLGFAAAGAVFLPQWPVANVWATPLAAASIVWLAKKDLNRSPSAPRRAWLQMAGRVSYAFYLVHGLVLLKLENQGLVLRAVVAFLISAVIGLALHKLVELPANRWIIDRLGTTSSRLLVDHIIRQRNQADNAPPAAEDVVRSRNR
ncbi:acyltransferase [Actinoplanes sp. TFC3]|uniref:acyltransferase family protein n=1 Tax=Actinoplanes sp. TFC3 TaxID=1710355 RepID=UPI0008344A57|nr:acyltransferase [Actinoplanes sp. TFC3]